MEDKGIIYANSFSIATNDFDEVVIVLELTTPHFENNKISGVSVQKVADIRLNTTIARMLGDSIAEEIAKRTSEESK